MSSAQQSPKATSRSVAIAAERTRSQRVQRLRKTLDERLVDPIPAVDALLAELSEGAPQPELWQQLHVAAKRDGVEAALGEAYRKCASGPRMKRLKPEAQIEVLLRAADYLEKVVHDDAGATALLDRVLTLAPANAVAFGRLEKRLEKALDTAGLLELYARVAGAPPRPAPEIATRAFNRVLQLSAKTPLPEETCRKLVALVAAMPPLLHALERHCCATKRFDLACALIEQALGDRTVAEPFLVQWRERLIELQLGEAASPSSAVVHVEELLKRDPAHASALDAAERLIETRPVSSRAAAALRSARRTRGH